MKLVISVVEWELVAICTEQSASQLRYCCQCFDTDTSQGLAEAVASG